MCDVKYYLEELNNIELKLLNNYLINCRFSNDYNQDNIKYLLITLDKNSNLRFNAYITVVKSLFALFFDKYLNCNIKNILLKKMEIFHCCKENQYRFSVERTKLEVLFKSLSAQDLTIILEAYHTNFLNTELVIKNGLFEYNISKINSKNTGSVYTQCSIAKEICYKAIYNKAKNHTNVNDITVLDFGSGSGRFYFSALEILKKHTQKSVKNIILNNLYAIDIDPLAINILRLTALAYLDNVDEGSLNKLFEHVICKNMLIVQNLSLFNNDETLLNLNIDFADILNNGGFDVIVSNPPYAILKVNKKDSDKKAYVNYYNELTAKVDREIDYFNNSIYYQYSTEGMLNYYKLSVEMILNLAKTNAEIGIICPATLFTDQSSKKLRKYLLLQNRLKEINYFAEKANLFDNVSQSTIIFYLTKGQKTENIKTQIGDELFNISLNDIKATFPNFEIPSIDKIGWSILNKLSKFQKLKDNSNIRNKRGELDLTLYKKFITNNPTQYRLVRGNMISAKNGIINKNNEFVLDSFVQNKSEEYIANDFNKIRLVCQQISNIDTLKRLNFTISEKNDIFANSCNYLSLKDLSYINTLSNILNSYLLNWRFKISSGNNHINNDELDELPLLDLNNKFISKNNIDLNIEICH